MKLDQGVMLSNTAGKSSLLQENRFFARRELRKKKALQEEGLVHAGGGPPARVAGGTGRKERLAEADDDEVALETARPRGRHESTPNLCIWRPLWREGLPVAA